VIYVDGVIGSLAPSGMVQMALFSEREAIPRSVSHAVDAEGRLGDIQSSTGRPGYVREVDVCAMMSLDTAKELSVWLAERIAELEAVDDGGGI
jgi:hypothetical protein